MRRLHYGDAAAAARALMAAPDAERLPLCLRMIREAQTADAYRLETGRAHPLWGSGSLMEVARARPSAPDPGFDHPEYCRALRLVLDCLIQAGLSRRRS